MVSFGYLDRATCHIDKVTFDVLRSVFKDRIRRRADVVWPSRGGHLTQLDYYLWSSVRDKCYYDKPQAIETLKDNIGEAIGEI